MNSPWIVPNNEFGYEFIKQIIHPDIECMEKRDKFFDELDHMEIEENENNSFGLYFNENNLI